SNVDPVESEPGIARPQSNFCCACGVQEIWKCTRPRLERKRHESMFDNACRNTAARRIRNGGCSSGDSKGTAQPSANGLRHSRCRVRNRQKNVGYEDAMPADGTTATHSPRTETSARPAC